MCLETHWPKAKEAKQDIICYKIVTRNRGMRRGTYKSYWREYRYSLNKRYHEPLFMPELGARQSRLPIDGKLVYFCDYGFHSYSKAAGHLFGMKDVLIKCVIPKGTRYYESTKGTEYCAEELRAGANFKLERTSDGYYRGYGAINRFDECKTENNPSPSWYNNVHYPAKKKILESIPWTGVVENPYCPKEGEYPTENGDYITMLDCDEHAVWTNIFRDGHWLIYDRTHVKWWMPMPDMTGIDLID